MSVEGTAVMDGAKLRDHSAAQSVSAYLSHCSKLVSSQHQSVKVLLQILIFSILNYTVLYYYI